jgi:2-polyprenyl-3-methyl-5-hydroxy-6-metoxy-1,4-benzoquinol methylase
MINLNAVASNIDIVEGIGYCDSPYAISYPAEGNQKFYGIEDRSFWYRHRNECIVECVRKFGDSEKPFIEIGSGNGFCARAIKELGFEVVLIEPDIQGIQNSKKRGLMNLICGPFEKIEFTKAFSNIGLFDVLEQIREDCELLRKINTLLSPDGVLVAQPGQEERRLQRAITGR